MERLDSKPNYAATTNGTYVFKLCFEKRIGSGSQLMAGLLKYGGLKSELCQQAFLKTSRVSFILHSFQLLQHR